LAWPPGLEPFDGRLRLPPDSIAILERPT